MRYQFPCILEIKFGLIALISCPSGIFSVSDFSPGSYAYASECNNNDYILKWIKDTFASRYEESDNNVQAERCSMNSDISIDRSPQIENDYISYFNFYKGYNVVKLRQAQIIPITIVHGLKFLAFVYIYIYIMVRRIILKGFKCYIYL